MNKDKFTGIVKNMRQERLSKDAKKYLKENEGKIHKKKRPKKPRK